MGFVQFMASTAGRALRIIAGLVLIALGLNARTTGGIILAIVGLAPLAAGVLDFCLIAPLLGKPFRGKDVRAMAKNAQHVG